MPENQWIKTSERLPDDTEWRAFLRECSNPRIGVLAAIQRQSMGVEYVKEWRPAEESDDE